MIVTIVQDNFFTDTKEGLTLDTASAQDHLLSIFHAGAEKELLALDVKGFSRQHAALYLNARNNHIRKQLYFNRNAGIPGVGHLIVVPTGVQAAVHMVKDAHRFKLDNSRLDKENPAEVAAAVLSVNGVHVDNDIVTTLNRAYRRAVKVITRSFVGYYIEKVGLIKRNEWIVTGGTIDDILGALSPNVTVETTDVSALEALPESEQKATDVSADNDVVTPAPQETESATAD